MGGEGGQNMTKTRFVRTVGRSLMCDLRVKREVGDAKQEGRE